jgi:hypothetical protein
VVSSSTVIIEPPSKVTLKRITAEARRSQRTQRRMQGRPLRLCGDPFPSGEPEGGGYLAGWVFSMSRKPCSVISFLSDVE